METTPAAAGASAGVDRGRFRIRLIVPTDEVFVVNTWAESFRGSHNSGVLPIRLYRQVHREFFLRVIRDRCKVYVAVDPDAEVGLEIFGFLVMEEWKRCPIIHFVYVKDEFRNAAGGVHIARRMFEEAGLDPERRFCMTTCRSQLEKKIRDAFAAKGRHLQLGYDPKFLRDPRWKERIDAIRDGVPQKQRPPGPWRAGNHESEVDDLE